MPDSTGEYSVRVVIGSLTIGVFFGGIGGGVAFPTLPTLGDVLGITPFFVGIILSANQFSRLVANTPVGQMIDNIGAKKPMVVGLIMQGVAPFGYIAGMYPEYVPFVGSVEIFIVARMFWGFGSAALFVGAFSVITRISTDANRGKWLGYFRSGQILGFPAGLILGGVLTDLYSYEVAFLFAGLMGLFASAFAFVVIPDLGISGHEPTSLTAIPFIIRKDLRMLVIGSVNLVFRFSWSGVMVATLVLYAEANDITLGLFSEVGVTGLLLGVSALFVGLTTLASGKLSDMMAQRIFVALPAMGLATVGFVILGLWPTFEGMLLALCFIGVGAGGMNPPLIAFLGDIAPKNDVGKMGGVYNAFGDVGATAGPIVGTTIGAVIGYETLYLICAGLITVIALFAFATLFESREDISNPSPQ